MTSKGERSFSNTVTIGWEYEGDGEIIQYACTKHLHYDRSGSN